MQRDSGPILLSTGEEALKIINNSDMGRTPMRRPKPPPKSSNLRNPSEKSTLSVLTQASSNKAHKLKALSRKLWNSMSKILLISQAAKIANSACKS